MKTPISIVTLLLAVTLIHAAPGDIEYNQRVFTLGEIEYVSQIPNVAPKPLWDPGQEAVPISVEEAFTLANDHFQKNFAGESSFRFQSIGLQRWCDGDENRFLYLVVFMQKPEDAKPVQLPGGGVQRKPLNIVYYVSLDGTLYPPERKKD